ncbi:uncharacterized protein [Rutidosis leptorrhynchoides]|uniref:uncharacterized protein n=1 Tax=Rutidosis leptorrhynchoides TaxID=125765 RepID=UPI003A9A15AC
MSPNSADCWNWAPGSKGCFTTKRLNELLESKVLQCQDAVLGTIRNNLVPKNIELFVWRARKGRLPTLPELDKRGIDLNSARCPICDDDIESLDHSLLSCKFAWGIWEKILEWLKARNIYTNNIRDLFDVESGGNFSDVAKSNWQGIIWTSGYLILKNRNDKVFKNKCWNVPVAVSEIQVKSYDWIAKRCKVKNLEWHNWLHNPSIYFS